MLRNSVAFAILLATTATGAVDRANLKSLPGFLPLFWDEKAGKLYLEIRDLNKEMLYVTSLPAGVGSNDLGLDRGQIGGERIVRWERSGPKILLVQPNYGFRATTPNADERRSVEEAFAQSVLWGFTLEEESNSTLLVDATTFFLRDAHRVIDSLRSQNQGTFTLDGSRSAFYLPRTRNFPKNTEVEVTLTFTGSQPGSFVRQVVPDPQAITVRQHHSFVELPPSGFKPRAFDPRAGYFGIEYMDFAVPVGEPITQRFIARHRLTRERPLVYYLDRGAPEPIRSALLEGARWWADAFAAAGYPGGFRVELLPEDADPMDLRYNVIQWVHRATRGWSYGNTVIDPRTGEILKGHVTLGSLRVRQDYLIAEGLLAPYEKGGAANPEMQRMALARLRQLSAHEVGHTLGLSHNYAASTVNRASVMDYPHPLALLNGSGAPDLSKAYAAGMGEWDKIAISYGYREFPGGTDESTALRRILDQAHAKGLYFITDSDARPAGGAHPQAHLWDNGSNAADELARIMEVRTQALKRFGENSIREGAPMSTLEEVLVPLYLSHRYQLEAASKLIGGLNYRYALRGDGQIIVEPVPAAEQRRTMSSLLSTLQPSALTLPDRILNLIPPRPPGYERHRETFRSRAGVAFDPLSAVEAAAQLTVGQILHFERATRLIQQNARDPKLPDLREVIEALLRASWKAPRLSGLEAETQRVIDQVVLYNLMALASNGQAHTQTRAIAAAKLTELKTWLSQRLTGDARQAAHQAYAAAQIKRWEENPNVITIPRPAEAPPGQPIGME